MIYNGQTAINHPWSACTRVSILIIQHLLCAISIISKGGRERVKVKLPFATVILFPEICFRGSSCNNFCHFKFCVTCKSSNCLRVYVVTPGLLLSLSMQSFLSQNLLESFFDRNVCFRVLLLLFCHFSISKLKLEIFSFY